MSRTLGTTEAGTRAGAQSAAKAGTRAGAQSAAKAGARASAQSAAKAGAKAGAEAGAKEPALVSLGRRLAQGLAPGWAPYFADGTFEAALAALDAAGDAEALAPQADLVLEAFRFGGPEDCRVVILAQDPYYTPGDAHGVCLSVLRDRPLPPSLGRVFGCLARARLRPARDKLDECGDLRSWAAQGVLLLNAALTTRLGESRAHAAPWRAFTRSLLERLSRAHREAGRRLHFLLWGADAQAHAAPALEHGHAVLTWSHPSPQADNRLPAEQRFEACPHFEAVNEDLCAAGEPEIVWDNLARVAAFTDGSCPLNGKAGARAGFAAVIRGGPFRRTVVRGEVAPCEYALVDTHRVELGVTWRTPLGAPPERGLVAPTNNRGELLGIIAALHALLAAGAAGPVEIVSDSEIGVRTLTEWLPTRLKKGTQHELKNFDLVWAAWLMLGRLREQAAAVTLTHTRSHRPRPPADAPARERWLHAGNALADRHAGEAIGSGTPTYALEVTGAPPAIARLAAS